MAFCAANMMRSQSQLFQDLFVVFFLQGKRNGFFVEFGATDGRGLSNTFILERDFQWNGILAEPARCWHAALKSARRAAIDTRCVWSESGQTLELPMYGAEWEKQLKKLIAESTVTKKVMAVEASDFASSFRR